jgi:hypothetical protein
MSILLRGSQRQRAARRPLPIRGGSLDEAMHP